jgi:signal transduction histidine kinase
VAPERWDQYREVVETRRPLTYETDYDDGTVQGSYEVQVAPAGDGCVVTLREVTERRRTEAALRDQAVRLARLEAEREQERLAAALARAQRLESLGRLAAGLAHDFNNVLAVIDAFTALLRTRERDAADLADLDRISEAVSSASVLTRELLRLGEGGARRTADAEPLEVAGCVEHALALIRHALGDRIALESALEPGVFAAIPAVELEHVLMNLLLNARDAMPDGGRIRVGCARRRIDAAEAEELGTEPGAFAVVEIADSGQQATDEVLRRAFDPFFTTKPRDEGSGLGLSTVRDIARELGGEVTLTRTDRGAGAVARLYLPVAAVRDPAH